MAEVLHTHARYSPGTEPSLPEEELESVAGEVEHDIANLVHRMYFWCEVLEEKVSGDPTGLEAAESMRASIGDTHKLISRAADLLRPVHVRTFNVPAADLLERILARLGARSIFDPTVLGDAASREIPVDPMPLDRALDMLGDAIGCGTGEDVMKAEVSVTSECFGAGTCVRLRLQAPALEVFSIAEQTWSPGSALEDVSAKLGARILARFGWLVEANVEAARPECSILIPL